MARLSLHPARAMASRILSLVLLLCATCLVPNVGWTQSPSASGDDTPLSSRTSSASRTVGRVVEIRPGIAVIDLGTDHGLARDDRVELFDVYEVEIDGEPATSERTVAVGRVVTIGAERAQVALGIDEQVETGMRARPTDRELTSDYVAPPRPAGIHSFAAMVRPFLGVGELAGGTVNRFSYAYAFEWPGMLEVRVDPLSFAVGDGPDRFAVAGGVSMSFDLPVFRIGLGVGVTRITECEFDPCGDDPEIRKTGNFQITQIVRLGARDGLHLEAHNSFVVKEERRSPGQEGELDSMFAYGGTIGTFQVSMNELIDNTWFLARGGYHRSGQAFGELGLRFLASGNGGRDSLFFEASAGGVALLGPRQDYGGPMIGFGLEYRL
jgi:hypothetical protein